MSSEESDGGVVFEASREGMNAVAEDEVRIVARPKAVVKPRVTSSAVLYVQTELVRGGTLRQWIEGRNASLGTASLEERQRWFQQSKKIFRQCVAVVRQMHKQGIVHRDIKPDNIMLAEDGNVRLGDFGLAKALSSSVQHPADSLIEKDQEVKPVAAQYLNSEPVAQTKGVGTPAYASPEQMREAKYGVEVDVYSLGVVLAELLYPVQTHMERAALLEGLRARHLPRAADALLPTTVMACSGIRPDGSTSELAWQATCASAAASLALAMTATEPRERPSAEEIWTCLIERDQPPCLQTSCSIKHNGMAFDALGGPQLFLAAA